MIDRSVTKHLLILLLAASASGCSRDPDAAALDNRIVWDVEGCAYTLRKNIGDNLFVYRMEDADKTTCAKRSAR